MMIDFGARSTHKGEEFGRGIHQDASFASTDSDDDDARPLGALRWRSARERVELRRPLGIRSSAG